MRKIFLFLALALLPLSLMAQEQEAADASSSTQERKAKKSRSASEVFTGFSGGMMVHAGYAFSDDPTKVFSNTGLGSYDYYKGLPKDGACFGLGGTLRVHLIDHIHLGAEGHVTTMPLMKTGSNIRTGWGGALCDFYGNWGKVCPLIGIGVGGGAMKRLFVPADSVGYVAVDAGGNDSTHYNSSYVKTPFFYLDPYVGLEINLNSHMSLLLRIDYMLPFGTSKSGLVAKDITWSNFMTPSGPRLYVGIMFGKLGKK